MNADAREPEVIEGELVSLAEAMPRPLQYPPAVREVCACRKNGTDYAHGAIGRRRPFTCAEVLEIAARVEAAGRPSWWHRILGGAR